MAAIINDALTRRFSRHARPANVGKQMINVRNWLHVPFVLRGLQTNKHLEAKLKRRKQKEKESRNIAVLFHCTFSSLSSSPWQKNQSCCWSEKTQHQWMMYKVTHNATSTSNTTSPHMQDERLHYLVSVGHVGDHVGHVVLRRSDQCGTEHQR